MALEHRWYVTGGEEYVGTGMWSTGSTGLYSTSGMYRASMFPLVTYGGGGVRSATRRHLVGRRAGLTARGKGRGRPRHPLFAGRPLDRRFASSQGAECRVGSVLPTAPGSGFRVPGSGARFPLGRCLPNQATDKSCEGDSPTIGALPRPESRLAAP